LLELAHNAYQVATTIFWYKPGQQAEGGAYGH